MIKIMQSSATAIFRHTQMNPWNFELFFSLDRFGWDFQQTSVLAYEIIMIENFDSLPQSSGSKQLVAKTADFTIKHHV